LETHVLVSLQAAFKNAIQVVYQLEDNELAVETLPSDEPRLVLCYESAEGGAGVLRRLLDDPMALANVAREALRICHFDPDTGEDLGRAARATEDCEAACYDCLMSYGNQRQHRLLDRKAIRDILLQLAGSSVESAPAPEPRAAHLQKLMRTTGSELERNWLRRVEQLGLRLPASGQAYVPAGGTRPDFLYDGDYTAAVYVDGPYHTQYEHRHQRDVAQTELMEDAGYIVIRFRHDEEWDTIFANYPYIFGKSGNGSSNGKER
jgi:very-short-patch-repair endonuclease